MSLKGDFSTFFVGLDKDTSERVATLITKSCKIDFQAILSRDNVTYNLQGPDYLNADDHSRLYWYIMGIVDGWKELENAEQMATERAETNS